MQLRFCGNASHPFPSVNLEVFLQTRSTIFQHTGSKHRTRGDRFFDKPLILMRDVKFVQSSDLPELVNPFGWIYLFITGTDAVVLLPRHLLDVGLMPPSNHM